jgi:hypothetical protein
MNECVWDEHWQHNQRSYMKEAACANWADKGA